jgi:uncharacterized protein (TIGR03067 family)
MFASGCSTPHKSDSATIQGTWKGRELTPNASAEGPCYLTISGQTLHFIGANTNEWYQGTFTLREDANPKEMIAVITECPAPNYVGRTSHAIYRLENATLTITGNEPGAPNVPAAFDAPGARQLVFNR